MRNKKWIIGLFLVSTLVLSSINVEAQDLRERTYYYEILEPRHEPKPEIKGFATERVKEKLDRGLTATPSADGKVSTSVGDYWNKMELTLPSTSTVLQTARHSAYQKSN